MLLITTGVQIVYPQKTDSFTIMYFTPLSVKKFLARINNFKNKNYKLFGTTLGLDPHITNFSILNVVDIGQLEESEIASMIRDDMFYVAPDETESEFDTLYQRKVS